MSVALLTHVASKREKEGAVICYDVVSGYATRFNERGKEGLQNYAVDDTYQYIFKLIYYTLALVVTKASANTN